MPNRVHSSVTLYKRMPPSSMKNGPSLNAFLDMSDDFVQTKEQVQKLGGEVQSISKVVDFIEGVADETELFALNTSIEAARSDDSGRDFARFVETSHRQFHVLVEQLTVTLRQGKLKETNKLFHDLAKNWNN